MEIRSCLYLNVRFSPLYPGKQYTRRDFNGLDHIDVRPERIGGANPDSRIARRLAQASFLQDLNFVSYRFSTPFSPQGLGLTPLFRRRRSTLPLLLVD